MCTNDAVNRLECYMDDLVDCFEDFVKKSLIIMSVVVGAILLLLSYLLKLLLDRTSSRSLRGSDTEDDRSRSHRASWSSLESRYLKDTASDSSLLRKKKSSSTSVLVDKKKVDTPVQMSAMPSMDERFLKEVGYSNCSKSCSAHKRNLVRNCSTSRIMVPSMPTCMPKHHLAQPRTCSKMSAPRKSCCSMCCADDDQRVIENLRLRLGPKIDLQSDTTNYV